MSEIELKPCPFCGGEAEMISEYFYSMGTNASQVRCKVCHSWGSPSKARGVEKQVAAAAKAWNTRYERTCHNVAQDRTCGEFTCSNCGHEDGPFEYAPEPGEYCKECGAKVVGE